MSAFSPTKPCFAEGCEARIPRRLLMCAKHWKLVPQRLQIEVYETLDAWQHLGSPAPYQAAIEAARVAVAELEAQRQGAQAR